MTCGEGQKTRAFCYVDDLISGLVSLMKPRLSSMRSFEYFERVLRSKTRIDRLVTRPTAGFVTIS